jgi:hypothetical protein
MYLGSTKEYGSSDQFYFLYLLTCCFLFIFPTFIYDITRTELEFGYVSWSFPANEKFDIKNILDVAAVRGQILCFERRLCQGEHIKYMLSSRSVMQTD